MTDTPYIQANPKTHFIVGAVQRSFPHDEQISVMERTRERSKGTPGMTWREVIPQS